MIKWEVARWLYSLRWQVCACGESVRDWRGESLRETLRLQEKDLAFEIGEAWIVFQGMEASEECFAIRRASVERGFENREGNLIKIVSI